MIKYFIKKTSPIIEEETKSIINKNIQDLKKEVNPILKATAIVGFIVLLYGGQKNKTCSVVNITNNFYFNKGV